VAIKKKGHRLSSNLLRVPRLRVAAAATHPTLALHIYG
jgi:hypothetical protein